MSEPVDVTMSDPDPGAVDVQALLRAVRAGCPSRPRTPRPAGWDCPADPQDQQDLQAGCGRGCGATAALAWAAAAVLPEHAVRVGLLVQAADPDTLCGPAVQRLLAAHTRLLAQLAVVGARVVVAVARGRRPHGWTWTR